MEFEELALHQTVGGRFAEVVSRYSEQIAIRTRRHSLTFKELDENSSRVAHALLDSGLGPGPVGLVFENGAPFVEASLGALKAGRPQLSLETSFPRGRLEYVLRQSGAAVLLTNSRHVQLASELSSLPVINIDDLGDDVPETPPSVSVSIDDPVIIDYTSGSTGNPKGMTWDHRGLMHVTRRHTNVSHISPHDGLLMFRASVRAYLSVLLNGARFYPVDLGDQGLADLVEWLAQEDITIYRSAVSQFRGLTSVLAGSERFPRVRLILLYGEPVYQADLDAYRRWFADDCILAASLGCNELDDYAYIFVDKASTSGRRVLPCGYPVADADVLILDDRGGRVAPGEVGEIAVSTGHPPAGYWREADRTRAAFIPHPDGSGVCIYRTGDLGRMEHDGCVLYLGRRDDQVKIRGYRVDIGEVESALLAFPQITAAAVVSRGDQSGNNQLVAYIVVSGAHVPTVRELRESLAATVPEFAIPTIFVMLEALPLTATGKVDRRCLPAPDGIRPVLDTPFLEPRTPVERKLARIWADILGLERVGILDHFLELGGDSLRAMRVIARITGEFGVRPPVQRLLESSTVAQMASVVTESQVTALEAPQLDEMLSRLDALSEEEARALLGDE